MHTDLKIQALMGKHGLDGYAIFNLCLELVGKEGEKGKLNGQTRWQDGLLKVSGWSDKDKLKIILDTLAELGLICGKSLKYGNLYIPKFMKRADNWSKRLLKSNSVETTAIDNNIIDKIRTEYIRLKGYSLTNLSKNDYGRFGRAIKTLLERTKGDVDLILRGLEWIAIQKYEWTLETLDKKWLDFINPTKKQEYHAP